MAAIDILFSFVVLVQKFFLYCTFIWTATGTHFINFNINKKKLWWHIFPNFLYNHPVVSASFCGVKMISEPCDLWKLNSWGYFLRASKPFSICSFSCKPFHLNRLCKWLISSDRGSTCCLVTFLPLFLKWIKILWRGVHVFSTVWMHARTHARTP